MTECDAVNMSLGIYQIIQNNYFFLLPTLAIFFSSHF